MKSFVTGVALLTLLPGFACLASAQTATTGEITGVVSDSTGALVPGAEIALTSSAGLKREAASSSSGSYEFTLLPPGPYTVKVSAKGFATQEISGIRVDITQIVQVNAALNVASGNVTVQVSERPALVQTDSAGTGRVIEQDTIRQLPLPTRNFEQLLTLSTGTSGPLTNSSELGRGDTFVTVNGNRMTSNSVVVNGVDAASIGTGSTENLAVPATDTLQQFIVQTSLYDASQGRNSGGIVAAVTKSGTDQFHGNVYEFLRNIVLNANNFFLNQKGQALPPYRRNQFGATLGGLLVKNRAWFFLSYQGTRETNGTSLDNSISTVFVPANLTDSSRTGVGLAAFLADYGLTAATVNPQALTILQATLPGGKYYIPSAQVYSANPLAPPAVDTISTISTYREDQANFNADFKISESNRLAIKSFVANNPEVQGLFQFEGLGNALPAPGAPAGNNERQRLVSVADTQVVKTNLVNEGRFGFSQIGGRFTPTDPFTASQFGISTPLQSLFSGAPTISIIDMMDLGPSPFEDNDAQVGNFSLGDTLTWTHGRHTIRWGGEYKRNYINEYFNLYPNGQEYFANFAAFLYGIPAITIQGSGAPARNIRANDFNAFMQDDWHLTKQLTVNLGLRYEVYGQFFDTEGRFVGFDPKRAATTTIAGQTVLTAGFVQAGNGSLPGIPKVANGLVPNDYNNVGPRVGFSFQPLQGKALVLRGGYGMYFDRSNSRLLNSQLFDSPYNTIAMAVASTTAWPNPANPFVHVPLPSTFPYAPNNPAVFPLGGPPWYFPASYVVAGVGVVNLPALAVPANGIYPNLHDFKTPYVQQWNLGAQWEAVKSLMFELAYVGAKGTDLTRVININQGAGSNALLFPGPYSTALSNLPNAALGTTLVQTDGASSYHSLQFSATKQLAHGLQFLASYTWSHSIDDYSGSTDNDLVGLPGDDSGPHQFAGSDFDRRQRFIGSFVYDLPSFYRGSQSLLTRTLNSWELAGIFVQQSGIPFSVIYGGNAFQYAYGTLVPGRSIASATKSGSTESRLNEYFDTTAFESSTTTYPNLYAGFGNSGRNSMIGPGEQNLDFSIVKFIPVTEARKFEFRTEFFNLANHASFTNPVSIVSSANFGQIVTTATGPRVIQFALKLNF